MTLLGLMQDGPLTLDRVVRRMTTSTGSATLVTSEENGVQSASFREVAADSKRVARGLLKLGVREGDTVATLGFNTRAHFEVSLAVPLIGAVFHAANPKLLPDQVRYVLEHGKCRIVFIDAALLDELSGIIDVVDRVTDVIVMGSVGQGRLPFKRVMEFADLKAGESEIELPPLLEENSASGLCHTTGTTGLPKGVLYSHRATLLHALSLGLADNDAISFNDRVLPFVPLYHANAWGLPYAAGLIGSDLILPGRNLTADALGSLIEQEQVTVLSGIPTVLDGLIDYADAHPGALRSLRLVVSGGASLPRRICEGFARHSVEAVQGWGMTETSPNVSISRPWRHETGEAAIERRLSAGRLNPLVDAKLIDERGIELPWDGKAAGEIWLSTPHGASGYFEPADDVSDRFSDGWLRTGDIASIDAQGYVRLRDRLKDVIKSGGEYISSLELERFVANVPGVKSVAVVARPDVRWGERPAAAVVLSDPSDELTQEDILRAVTPHVPKWWLPFEVRFVSELPLTSVGKPDKGSIRKMFAEESAVRKTP